MKITTLDIIKLLPFQKEFKQSLLEGFDTLDPDRKYAIEGLLWDAYDAYVELRVENNFEKALEPTSSNKDELDSDFYKKIREQTKKEIELELHIETANVDLAAVRAKIEAVINEGNAPQ